MALSSTSCPSCNTPNGAGSAFCNNCGSPLTGGGSPSGPTGRLASGQVLKQRYRIIQIVGQGGMGAVYKAEDIQFGNRLVAVKEMRQTGLDTQELKEAADAFRQEAIILAHLQHPNLPSIFDHFEENGRWYLVMSFIEGETLADYFSHALGGKLPLDEALQIGMQLCTVLGYLHNQQPAVIFRDLKPANIMRTPDGHIYLIDFGIARHFKPGQAKDTAYFGSMGYAPREQFGKAQTTPRSDIYSLGATLHQLISRHDPSSSPFRFPLLQSLVPTVPTNLATLITQMLELDEDKRPANMAVVKQELERIADQQRHPPVPPTITVPPTIPTPVIIRAPQKKGATRRNVIIGLIVLVVVVVIGLVASHPSPPTSPPNIQGTYSGETTASGSSSSNQMTLDITQQNHSLSSTRDDFGGTFTFTTGSNTPVSIQNGTVDTSGNIQFSIIGTDANGNDVTVTFNGTAQSGGGWQGSFSDPSQTYQGTWSAK
jgi:serine/threonine protein kinase